MKALDLVGFKFGRLTVKEKAPSYLNKTRWVCSCFCGAVSVHSTGDLRAGYSKSCGCLLKAEPAALRHGHNRKGQRTRTYRIWAGMVSRCTSASAKDYRFYGAKGISVCDRWRSFENFLADMGESIGDMTIDRINPRKGYEPSNCRWIPHVENCRKLNKGTEA